jgi:hypothetical protein
MVADASGCGACLTTYHTQATCPRVWATVGRVLEGQGTLGAEGLQAVQRVGTAQAAQAFAEIHTWDQVGR